MVLSNISLLFALVQQVTHLLHRPTLTTGQRARKGGVLGTNYFLPFWVCRRSKTGYPKPIAAIKVPAKPFLGLSGTLHHILWPVEQRIKRVTTEGCFLQTTSEVEGRFLLIITFVILRPITRMIVWPLVER